MNTSTITFDELAEFAVESDVPNASQVCELVDRKVAQYPMLPE